MREQLRLADGGLELLELLVGRRRMTRCEWCGDRARADRIAPDAVLTEFERRGLGQVDDGGLGDRVQVGRPTGL